MATIAAVVRWADNTADLARNLKEGVNQIEATRASVEKLVQTFSGEKLIAAAHRNVAAIKEMGGAFKLSESQATRSLGIITDAIKTLERHQKPVPDAMRAMKAELEAVVPATTNWGDKLQLVFRAFQALMALQVVQWFKQGITAALDYADSMANLSSKTSISVEGLQRLESLGITASVSIDAMARAVNALYKNLDSPAGKKAIRDMGLDYQALRALDPEQLFLTMGKAVMSIHDPIDRANAKTALFARTFDEVAAAFDQDVDKIVSSAQVMSEAQIRALDAQGDAWDRWYLNTKRNLFAHLGDLAMAAESNPGGMLSVLAAKALGLDGMIELARKREQLRIDSDFESNLPKLKSPSLIGAGPTPIDDASHVQFLRDVEQALDKRAAALKRMADEQARWNERVRQFSGPAKGFEYEMAMMHFQMRQFSDMTLEADQRALGLLGTLADFKPANLPVIETLPRTNGMGYGPATLPQKTFTESLDKTEMMLGYLNDVDQILSGINAKWAQMATVAVRAVGAVITKLAEGDWIGATVAGIAGLIGVFGELFGITEESQRVSPVREEFFKLQGGLETLNPRILELTGNLRLVQAVFDARTVKDYEAAIAAVNDVLERNKQIILDANALHQTTATRLRAITVMTPALQAALDKAMDAKNADELLGSLKDINKELDEQQRRFDSIRGTLAKYKIPESEAKDPLFATQVINERARELREDYENIRKSGVDINVGMRAMGGSINQFVQDAIKMGVEVPEAMREVIQVAMDAGEILDATGKPIKDMSELGLVFGTTMETVMSTVGSAVDRLNTILEAMAKFFGITLPNAAQDGADGIQDALDTIQAPDLTVRVGYDIPELPDYVSEHEKRTGDLVDGAFHGGLVTEQGIQRFAAGGRVLNFVPRGTDTVPAMLTPGEVVLTKGQQQDLAGAMTGGGTTVYIDATGATILDGASLDRWLDTQVFPKLPNAITKDVGGIRRVIKRTAA